MSKLRLLLREYKNSKSVYLNLTAILICTVLIINYSFIEEVPIVKKSENPSEKDKQEKDKKENIRYNLLETKIVQMEKALEQLAKKDDELYESFFDKVSARKSYEKNTSKKYLAYDETYIDKLENKAEGLDRKIEKENHYLERILKLAKKNEAKYARIPAIRPITRKDMKGMVSGFGVRYHPILRIRRMHSGLDFSAKSGSSIYATADGIVKVAAFKAGFGNMVKINHQSGYETVYAHMKAYRVKPGQKIKRGDVIGYVGSTGLSTGPHLHYEVIKQGTKVDPLGYFYNDLSPDEYKRIFTMATKMSRSLD